MVEKANSLGFTHYALSEHVPRSSSASLYPEEIESNIGPKELLATFMNYLSEARKCSEYWENKSGKRIQVLVGAETENVDGRNYNTLDFLDQVLRDDKGWKVEYLVGSVHHVQSVPIDFDKETFNKALEQFMEPHCDTNENESYRTIAAHLKLMCGYLDAQLSVMERFQPEIIGHFDLCRLFLPQTPMTLAGRHRVSDDQHTQTLLEAVDKRVRRNIDFAIEYGALFELNSASVRKGWSTPYPGSDILEVSRSDPQNVTVSLFRHRLSPSGEEGCVSLTMPTHMNR